MNQFSASSVVFVLFSCFSIQNMTHERSFWRGQMNFCEIKKPQSQSVACRRLWNSKSVCVSLLKTVVFLSCTKKWHVNTTVATGLSVWLFNLHWWDKSGQKCNMARLCLAEMIQVAIIEDGFIYELWQVWGDRIYIHRNFPPSYQPIHHSYQPVKIHRRSADEFGLKRPFITSLRSRSWHWWYFCVETRLLLSHNTTDCLLYFTVKKKKKKKSL